MRKFIGIFILIALLVNCAQKIGVGIQEDFSPEIKVKTGQEYPELKVTDFVKEIKIGDKTFAIGTVGEKSVVKLPPHYQNLMARGNAKPVDSKDWQVSYNKSDKILYILPPTDTLEIECQKQDPENFDNYIDFTQQDFDSVSIYFKNIKLPPSRMTFHSADSLAKSIIKLQIPAWKSIVPSNYNLKISNPVYEDFTKKLPPLVQDGLKLGLEQVELTIQLLNKESSPFMPENLFIENAKGDKNTYLTTQIEGGVELYKLEFPVKVYGSKYKWQFFNYKDEKIEEAVYTEPGSYKLYFLEKERELPIVMYDISREQIDRSTFENWVRNKMNKIDNIFLYITNGYENSFNGDNQEYDDILNKIYRMRPRTSNILESIERFSLTLKRKNILDNYLNSPAQYGNKLQPRYYIFLSGDNVERLSTAVQHFTNKIDRVKIPEDKLTICIDQKYANTNFFRSLKSMNIDVITL